MMKKIKAMIMLLPILGTMALHSCNQTLSMDDIFEVSVNNISLSYQGLLEDGNNAEIEIATSGSWQVASKPEWIDLSKSAGERGRHTIFVIVEEVGTEEDREGKIVFESLGGTIAVDVAQVRKVEELNVSPSDLSVNIRGLLSDDGTPAIYISTNSDWQISELPEWITVDQIEGNAGNTSVVLTIANNDTEDIREGAFIVSAGGMTQEVSIEQDLSYVPLTETTLITSDQYGTITNEAETFEINAIEAWTVTSDSWIDVTPTSGDAGTTEVTVSINPTTEARTGTITITDADGLTTVITVEQEMVMPDDGEAVGFVYLEDDFSWCAPFGGVDEIAQNATGSTVPIHNNADANAAVTSRGYEDINPGGTCFYLGEHYFKMGRSGNQTGVRLNGIPNIDSDKSTNATLTFNATPIRGGDGNYDNVQLVVEIEGSGTVGDESSKVSEEIDISIPNQETWHWVERSVVLYGISADTKVTIKTTKNGSESGFFRWSLNDVKFEKHSVVE